MGDTCDMIEDLRVAFRGLSLGKEQRTLAVQAIARVQMPDIARNLQLQVSCTCHGCQLAHGVHRSAQSIVESVTGCSEVPLFAFPEGIQGRPADPRIPWLAGRHLHLSTPPTGVTTFQWRGLDLQLQRWHNALLEHLRARRSRRRRHWLTLQSSPTLRQSGGWTSSNSFMDASTYPMRCTRRS